MRKVRRKSKEGNGTREKEGRDKYGGKDDFIEKDDDSYIKEGKKNFAEYIIAKT